MSNIEIANVIFCYFPKDFNGIFVEVGAAHPVNISISFLFRPLEEQKKLWHFIQAHKWDGYEPPNKWQIISIEPNPEFCEEFKKMDLPILEYAACSEDKGQTDFRISPCPMSSSALEVRYGGDFPIENGAGGWWMAEDFKTVQVKALTLNTILKNHHPEIEKIDILIIDTEGWELDVLKGFDIIKFNPTVIVIENANGNEEYEPYMKSFGYKLDRCEAQDGFYIKFNI